MDTKWLPIVGAGIAAVNAWIIFVLGRYLDRQRTPAAAAIIQPSSDTDSAVRIRAARRRLRWFFFIGTAVPVIGVILTLYFPVSRMSLFFIFLFSTQLSYVLNTSVEASKDLSEAEQWHRIAGSFRRLQVGNQAKQDQIE